jgi:hypothetical protein
VEFSTGGIRLELLYPWLLTAMLLSVWQTIVVRWAKPVGSQRWGVHHWLLLGTLLVLEFLLQGRRLMITFVVFGALVLLQQGASLQGILRTRGRQIAAAGIAGFVTVMVLFGAPVWRAAAAEFGAVDVSLETRLSLMARNIDMARQYRLSERITYLGLNGAAIEYGDMVGDALTLPGMATSSLVETLPGLVFPWKYGADGAAHVDTCETAFNALTDLPCTPEAEALLAGGPLAVLFVAFIWGAFFVLLQRVLALPSFLARLVGLVGFIPMSLIETSAFPMFRSLRLMLIVGVTVWAGAALLRLFDVRGHLAHAWRRPSPGAGAEPNSF